MTENWKPKQGEEIEVSDNGEDWGTAIFVTEYDNEYWCESKEYKKGNLKKVTAGRIR